MVTGRDEVIVRFLGRCGAGEMPHRGGTLLEHLVRVREVLRGWDARPALATAGLCHAAYGTDAFPPTLLNRSVRSHFALVIGDEAERLVYLYGSAERAALWPRLGRSDEVDVRDRFTGETRHVGDQELRDFVELSAANELDLARHNPRFAAEDWPPLRDIFIRSRSLMSEPAWADCAGQ
jgi:hypothetical protein